MLTRRSLAPAAAALFLAAPAALAQPRSLLSAVMLVTHSTPGGGSDVFLRGLITHLAPVMGVSFSVQNVRGGSDETSVARVARAAERQHVQCVHAYLHPCDAALAPGVRRRQPRDPLARVP